MHWNGSEASILKELATTEQLPGVTKKTQEKPVSG
jgi:hypothetical protein